MNDNNYNDFKPIMVKKGNHKKLDIVRAKRGLRTFDATIGYLLDFEYKIVSLKKGNKDL